MQRETLRNGALAALGVVAVALTATTLPSARQPERAGAGPVGAPGSGSGGMPARQTEPLPQLLDIPFLPELLTAVFALGVLVALAVLFRHWRAAFRVAVATIAVALLAALIVQFVPMGAPPSPAGGVPGVTGNASGPPGGGDSGTASGPSLLSLAVVLVIGAAVLGTVVAANRRRDDEEDSQTTDPESSATVAAVGRAAGRAADRIETSAESDNEVYRAWREMIGLLDVPDSETTTAREFERAAVDAGLTRSDVAELTDLFERARYGDYEPDATDEERAVSLLRRIEDRYADGEHPGGEHLEDDQ